MEAGMYGENMRPNERADGTIRWFSPKEPPFRLGGFPWFGQDHVYRRLPLRPKWPLPEAVGALANHTAGGQIQFQTDSLKLAVRVRLAGPADMDHMPASGQCGFDCYIGPPKAQRYCGTAYGGQGKASYEAMLFDLSDIEMRNVTLNFPLYQGVEEAEVGLEAGARTLPPPPYDCNRRVVVYGTSIVQGACAARPGMAYSNILSRRLNRPFINLGFSGSGKGEREVAQTAAEITDPACFILDYEANVSLEGLKQTLPDFIEILREAQPEAPVLVLSKMRFAMESFSKEAMRKRLEGFDIQRRTVDEFRADGDQKVFFHDGAELLGGDFDECTVDGVHPSDLGFWRMAQGLAPVLQGILSIRMEV